MRITVIWRRIARGRKKMITTRWHHIERVEDISSIANDNCMRRNSLQKPIAGTTCMSKLSIRKERRSDMRREQGNSENMKWLCMHV